MNGGDDGLFVPGPAGAWKASPTAIGDPPSRRDGRETSKAAGRSMRHVTPTIRRRVLDYIRSCGAGGATGEQVSEALNLRIQTASARVCELAQAGAIEDSGTTRPTTSGRAATVWVASDGENCGASHG